MTKVFGILLGPFIEKEKLIETGKSNGQNSHNHS
ncbi:hypothetical protein SB30_120151 [Klebsiella quasipneumoniae subsp. similipneumoniae]|nr:hypothetical protein SB30_120151 [Klebsiella quasipneumoniae subsp. similipneumoniae]